MSDVRSILQIYHLDVLSLGIIKLLLNVFLKFKVGLKCYLTRFGYQDGWQGSNLSTSYSRGSRLESHPGDGQAWCSFNLFSSFIRHESRNTAFHRQRLVLLTSLYI
jgi:hypothetical protein